MWSLLFLLEQGPAFQVRGCVFPEALSEAILDVWTPAIGVECPTGFGPGLGLPGKGLCFLNRPCRGGFEEAVVNILNSANLVGLENATGVGTGPGLLVRDGIFARGPVTQGALSACALMSSPPEGSRTRPEERHRSQKPSSRKSGEL